MGASAIGGDHVVKTTTAFSILAILVAFANLASLGAARATECNGKADRVVFGVLPNAGFSIESSGACASGDTAGGMVRGAKVVRQTQHGSVKLPDNSSFGYRAQPGYSGSDAFVIEATGSDTRGTETSAVTYGATVR